MKKQKEQLIFRAKAPVLNATAVLADSKQFFLAHKMGELTKALPVAPLFSKENSQKIIAAMSGDFGGVRFDRAFMFPPLSALNKAPIAKFKCQFADRKLRGLPLNEQYTPSYMEDGVEKSQIIKSEAARRQQPYMLMYSSLPIPEETKDLTFPNAIKLFARKSWNGLWLPEHYVVQRAECVRNRDHRFDAWDNDPVKSQVSWLLATMAPSGCVSVHFDPSDRQVEAYWGSSIHSHRGLGVRPAVVVEML